jgi:chemotaxis protein methyltransferase CheR
MEGARFGHTPFLCTFLSHPLVQMIVDTSEPSSGSTLTITDAEFARFQTFVREATGINLTDIKKALVVARLGNRVRCRKALSFAKYYKIITDPTEGDELQIAIDMITTNETSFFREPTHFEILKEFIQSRRPLPLPFRVWSAASSSGEEAYSIAMVLGDVIGAAEWEVLGSDISTRVLERARNGLYPLERSSTIPSSYLHRFCLKGKGNYEGMFLIGKNLRDRTRFAQMNLCRPLPEMGKFDVIFLRNILIYFDLEQKREVVESILTKMKPHSLLIVGHSESLNGVTNRITAVRPTVYRAL